jgi:hypothetical protein
MLKARSKIPLFTSIPPSLSRTNAVGEKIGRSYQERCILSWTEAAFEPATINCPSELVASDIRRLTVNRDASDLTGRPHVYFDDVIAAIVSNADGPFALVNADIITPPSARLAERVAAITPGHFFFSRRLDRTDVDEDQDSPYRHGFDFFAGHTDDLRRLVSTHLVFGAPWWDHYLPLAMHMRGRRITQLEPQVIHLAHAERWNPVMWDKFGERFVSSMAPIARGSYRWRLRAILHGATGGRRSAIKANLKLSQPSHSERQFNDVLLRISDLNLWFLDRQAPITSSA